MRPLVLAASRLAACWFAQESTLLKTEFDTVLPFLVRLASEHWYVRCCHMTNGRDSRCSSLI